MTAQAKRDWFLLSPQGLVLVTVSRNPGVTVTEIGRLARLGTRTVLRALADLEAGGMLQRVRHGRRNLYVINQHVHFRHPAMDKHSIEELLRIFSADQTSGTGVTR